MNAPSPIVHIYVLLDHSGSMSAMAEQVVAGFNRLVAEQQADGHDARMTLVQFDDVDPREVVFEGIPLAEVVPLRSQDFEPRGHDTPAGCHRRHHPPRRGADRRAGRRLVNRPEQVLVVTITDGEENHSQEFTRRRVVELGAGEGGRGVDLRLPRRRTGRLPGGRLDGLPARVRSVVRSPTARVPRSPSPASRPRPPTSAASCGRARRWPPATSSRATSPLDADRRERGSK